MVDSIDSAGPVRVVVVVVVAAVPVVQEHAVEFAVDDEMIHHAHLYVEIAENCQCKVDLAVRGISNSLFHLQHHDIYSMRMISFLSLLSFFLNRESQINCYV